MHGGIGFNQFPDDPAGDVTTFSGHKNRGLRVDFWLHARLCTAGNDTKQV